MTDYKIDLAASLGFSSSLTSTTRRRPTKEWRLGFAILVVVLAIAMPIVQQAASASWPPLANIAFGWAINALAFVIGYVAVAKVLVIELRSH